MTGDNNSSGKTEVNFEIPSYLWKEIYGDSAETKFKDAGQDNTKIVSGYSKDPIMTAFNAGKNRTFYRVDILGIPKLVNEENMDMTMMVSDVGNQGLYNVFTDCFAELMGFVSQYRNMGKGGNASVNYSFDIIMKGIEDRANKRAAVILQNRAPEEATEVEDEHVAPEPEYATA